MQKTDSRWPARLEAQRERRKANGNADTLKYERTVSGKLMRIYRNMESRITGVQKKKFHLYAGKSLLPREEFYNWARQDSQFMRLFVAWEASGYARKLAPTVDRIDSAIGYEIGNMEWVTHSENSRRGAMNKRKEKA